jgi:hypothetical protein
VKALTAVLLLLAGCGGGGGGSVSTTPPVPRTTPPQVVYWYTVDEVAKESAAETGSIWATNESQLQAALSVGATSATILVDDILQEDGAETQRLQNKLANLRVLNLLSAFQRVTLFVCDECEQQGFSDAQMERAATKVRSVAAGFSEIPALELEVNYGCANQYVGYQYFDRVGCDRYDRSAVETLGNLQSKAPGKKWRLYSGGSFMVDPMPYIKLALCDQRIDVTYFIRQNTTDRGNTYPGIRGNGMAPAYAAASALARSGAPCSG